MKIQLDTTKKVIKVEESVNLGELMEAIEKMFPNGTWKGFKLETNTTINWGNVPTIIEKYPAIYPYYPVYPWWHNPITYMDVNTYQTTGIIETRPNTLISGVYDVEIQ